MSSIDELNSAINTSNQLKQKLQYIVSALKDARASAKKLDTKMRDSIDIDNHCIPMANSIESSISNLASIESYITRNIIPQIDSDINQTQKAIDSYEE